MDEKDAAVSNETPFIAPPSDEAADSTNGTELISIPEPLSSLIKSIRPYERVFASQGVKPLLQLVVDHLESLGHCPSIALDSKDTESFELHLVRDYLAQVSLKEHSYKVAEIIIALLKDTCLDFEILVPKAVIAALAHDLGKIPEYRLSGIYNTSEHPSISACKLRELSDGMRVSWLDDALDAIREHHSSSDGRFADLLRQADRAARQRELVKLAKGFSVVPFHQWFDPQKLVKLLEPHINHIQSGGKWKAISFRRVVYCFPDFLFEKVKDLCLESKVLDLKFICISEKEAALKQIIAGLRLHGYIPEMLQQHRYAVKFYIKGPFGAKPFILTPIKGDFFNLKEIEVRKVGYLGAIKQISLSKRTTT